MKWIFIEDEEVKEELAKVVEEVPQHPRRDEEGRLIIASGEDCPFFPAQST